MASSGTIRKLHWLAISTCALVIALAAMTIPGTSYADDDPAPNAPATSSKSLTVADGGGDETAPVLVSASVLNPGATVSKPGALEVRLNIVEEGTGVNRIQVYCVSDTGKSSAACQNDYDSLWTGTIDISVPIPADAHNGTWHIRSVSMSDQAGNERYLYEEEGAGGWTLRDNDSGKAIASPAFTVTGSQGDETAPALVSASVLNPGATVSKPGVLKVRLGIVEEGTGVKFIQVYCVSDTGKSSAVYEYLYDPPWSGAENGRLYLDSPLHTGTVDMNVPIPADAHNGTWHIRSVSMSDQAGNECYLYEEEGAGGWVFRDNATGKVIASPAFTVTGAQGDETAPALVSASVLNPGATVSKPGVLKVRLGIVEEGTGVKLIQVICVSDTGKSFAIYMYYYDPPWSGAENDRLYLDSPLHTGTVDMNVPIPADAHNGAWHIRSVSMSDQAGNVCYLYEEEEEGAGGWVFRDYATGKVIASPAFTVKDEFTYAFAAALSNPKLISKLKSMKEGTAARILIDGNQILPKAAFDAIKGHDRTIVAYKGGLQWIFNGKNIVHATKDVDLHVTIGTVPGSALSSGKKAVSCTFANNGLLPGKAQVRFKSDYLYNFAGVEGRLNLYYVTGENSYKKESGNFDLVFDGTDKWCYMEVTHNSKFLVSAYPIRPLKMKDAKLTGVKTRYAYTGNTITPKVKVKLGGKTLKAGTHYTVSIKNNQNVGTATITIKGKGTYAKYGSTTKTFTIAPRATTLSKLTAGKGTMTVKWNAVASKYSKQTTGYQVRYSTSKAFKTNTKTVSIKGASKKSKKITKLQRGKTYYVQVRTYKKSGGKIYYSAWSKAKSVKIK